MTSFPGASVAVGVRLLSEERLPIGPRRDLVLLVRRFYDLAGRPSVRDISRQMQRIREQHGGGCLSHDGVQTALSGARLPRRQNLDALVHALVSMQSRGERVDLRAAIEEIGLAWLVIADDPPALPSTGREAPERSRAPGWASATADRAQELTAELEVDYLLAVDLAVEFQACLAVFGGSNDVRPVDLSGPASARVWPCRTDDFTYAICSRDPLGGGLDDVLAQVRSRGVVMVGIAAGRQDLVQLGDVLVADAVYTDMADVDGRSVVKAWEPAVAHIRGALTLQQVVPDWPSQVRQVLWRWGVADRTGGEAQVLDEWEPTVKMGALLGDSRVVDGRLVAKRRPQPSPGCVARRFILCSRVPPSPSPLGHCSGRRGLRRT